MSGSRGRSNALRTTRSSTVPLRPAHAVVRDLGGRVQAVGSGAVSGMVFVGR